MGEWSMNTNVLDTSFWVVACGNLVSMFQSVTAETWVKVGSMFGCVVIGVLFVRHMIKEYGGW